MKVYREFDQQQLDAQYNLRARWPEHAEFMADWARRGERERARPGWRLDLAYGPATSERLDLLVPAATSGARPPLFVFIHGGYWQALDKRDCDWMGPPFAAAGIAFASLNYALAPPASLDAIIAQVRAAAAWLWREGPGLGFDPGRIFVGGHSAGGHLAAMLAATDWGRLGGLPRDLIRGAVGVSGVYDLEPIRLCYHNAALRLDAAAVRRCSPLRLAPRPGIAVLATVGERETPEFHRQQAEFAAAWTAQGAAVATVDARGLHHFDILAKVVDFDHPIGRAIRRLLAV